MLRQPTEFVAPEFTTWRDEQRAWREGIAFYDQSFHMTTTYLRGAEAQRPVAAGDQRRGNVGSRWQLQCTQY